MFVVSSIYLISYISIRQTCKLKLLDKLLKFYFKKEKKTCKSDNRRRLGNINNSHMK